SSDRPSENELDRHRLGELGSAAEASPARVERMAERLEGLVGDRVGERLLGGFELTRASDRLDHPAALDLDLIAPGCPRVGDAAEHLTERGQPVAWLIREIGA